MFVMTSQKRSRKKRTSEFFQAQGGFELFDKMALGKPLFLNKKGLYFKRRDSKVYITHTGTDERTIHPTFTGSSDL